MRIVDIVTVKGSVEPMELWTCDIDLNALQQEKPPKKKETWQVRKMNKVRERIFRNWFKEACFLNQIQVTDKFELDEDLKIMR